MEKATVSITKNLIEVYNRDYGKKREGAPQYVTKISTTKTRSTTYHPTEPERAESTCPYAPGGTIYGVRRLCGLHSQPEARYTAPDGKSDLLIAASYAPGFAALRLPYAAPYLRESAVCKEAAGGDHCQHPGTQPRSLPQNLHPLLPSPTRRGHPPDC